MLCLSDSIRHDDPCVQRLLHAVDQAQTLTQLILAVWPLARVLAIHIIESVLAERALSPTFWPRCPTCGAFLRSKGFVQPRSRASLDRSAGAGGWDGVPRAATPNP